MTHAVAVDEIEFAELTGTDEQMRMGQTADRVRQDNRATCAKVVVLNIHGALVEGREIICQGKVRSLRQLDEAVTEVLRIWSGIEGAVAGHAEDGPIGRGGKARAAHPEPTAATVGCAIVDANLLQ